MKARLPVLGVRPGGGLGDFAALAVESRPAARCAVATPFISVVGAAPRPVVHFANQLIEAARRLGCPTALVLHDRQFDASALRALPAAVLASLEPDAPDAALGLLASVPEGQLALGLGWSWLAQLEPLLSVEVEAQRSGLSARATSARIGESLQVDLRVGPEADGLATRLGHWLGTQLVLRQARSRSRSLRARGLTPGSSAPDS